MQPNYKKNKLIYVITGQTATGKTKLALEYATKYDGELVNCDSRQIYKKLNIITGKDLKKGSRFKVQSSKSLFDIGYYLISTGSKRLQPISIKLWLYDIVDPKTHFSSFDYTRCAFLVINDIIKRGKVPIIVGGSGLYLKHLLYGFDNPIPPNWPIRQKLEKKTILDLQHILQKLISRASSQPFQLPELKKLIQQSKLIFHNNSDYHNPRRLIRRIEILSFLINNPNLPNNPNHPNLNTKFIGLKYKNKQDLVKAINTRVEKRLHQGAINEVKKILQQGYTENDPGLKTIGYQQIMQYLKGKLNKKEAVGQWVAREIQYAKRQITYMKKYFQIDWKEL